MIVEVSPDDYERLDRLAATHAASFSANWTADDLASWDLTLADDWDSLAVFMIAVDEADLLTIAVAPQHRRQGRARAVLQGAYPVLVAKGVRKIHLEVSAVNNAAMALYCSEGFQEVGRRKRYYPDESDAITMTRLLDVNG